VKTAPSSTAPAAARVPASAPSVSSAAAPAGAGDVSADFKDAFLAEIRRTKFVFYSAVVVQAQSIEVTADRVSFVFSAGQRALRDNCEQQRAWLEAAARKVAGRQVAVSWVLQEGAPAAGGPAGAEDVKKTELREQALADAGVKALLEVFSAEIRDVEEM
jgi:hypothetical protein